MNSSEILGVTDAEMRCPLSGAAKAIAMIDGAAMIVIGTEECTYYTVATLGMRANTKSCHSFVLDSGDVTFGCADRVAEMIDKVMTQSRPQSLFLVTTCVVEITGEDYTAVALDAEARYGVPVRVVQTCHFRGKGDDHGWESVQKAAAPFAPLPSMGAMLLQRLKMKFAGEKRGQQSNSVDLPQPSYRMGLLWTLLEESNDLVLEYGTAGTTAYLMKTMMMRGVDVSDRLFTTGLSENEVVMGDVTKLENAIKKLDESYSPRRIYILSSAVSEVTGADVKGVCNYMQMEVKAEILPITGNGFGGSFDDGVAAARNHIG
ncbi:MAG: nitrogenase component 1 [Rikenellaceae bacterium]